MPNWENEDIIRCTCRLRSATGEDIVNVYHFKLDLISDIADTAMMNAIGIRQDQLYDIIQPEIPSDVTFVDIDYQNVSKGLVYAAVPWPTQTSGGGTGDTMPEQNCGLVVGRTNVSEVVGRKFLGPFIEASNLDGVWGTTLTGMLQDFAIDYLINVYESLGREAIPGVVHYVAGVVTRFAPLISAYATNGIYTQRRRRRGVGA